MTVTKRTRYEVLRRDESTCRYCHATDQPLTVDHVVPVALGGTDDPSNLVAACKDCNAGKSSSSPDAPLVAQVADDAVRWSAAMALAAKNARGRSRALNNKVMKFEEKWHEWKVTGTSRSIPLPNDWALAIEGLLAAGMGSDDLNRAVEIAMGKWGVSADDTFRYFMGVAKGVLKQRMEEASSLIASGAA